jgi:hypothetical protein
MLRSPPVEALFKSFRSLAHALAHPPHLTILLAQNRSVSDGHASRKLHDNSPSIAPTQSATIALKHCRRQRLDLEDGYRHGFCFSASRERALNALTQGDGISAATSALPCDLLRASDSHAIKKGIEEDFIDRRRSRD